MGSENPRFVYQTIIRAPLAKVWRAITRLETVKKFYYGLTLRLSLKPGAPIEYYGKAAQPVIAGQVLEVVPRKKLVHTFAFRHRPNDAPSRVTWLLEKQGRLVKLTLIHDRFRGKTGTYRDISGGWIPILSGLKTLLETGRSL
jgi:uncharacterized protein YndB with AHSA1/START domain